MYHNTNIKSFRKKNSITTFGHKDFMEYEDLEDRLWYVISISIKFYLRIFILNYF